MNNSVARHDYSEMMILGPGVVLKLENYIDVIGLADAYRPDASVLIQSVYGYLGVIHLVREPVQMLSVQHQLSKARWMSRRLQAWHSMRG